MNQAQTGLRQTITPGLACMLLLGLCGYRLWVLARYPLNLHFDEAQYWLWAQQLQWGYFSKPPMIAWAIALQQWLFGEQVFALKALALSVYPLTTWLVYRIARCFYAQQVAIYSALLFITMPAVSLSSMIISTDVFLMLFWALAVYMVCRGLKSGQASAWIWAGVAAGLGLLTKYTMLLFLPSTFIAIYCRRAHLQAKTWRMICLASVIAAMIWLPNIIWNIAFDMASFRHVYEISQLEKQRLQLGELMAFLGAQFAVFGFVSMGLFIRYCLLDAKAASQSKTTGLWLGYFSVFMAVICAQALWSRAFANWAAPAYITAVIWLSARMCALRHIRWLNVAILVNIMTMGLMYHYEGIYQLLGVTLTAKTDPMRMVRGWDVLGQAVGQALKAYPHRVLLTENRKILSELIYYVHPHPFNAVLFNPHGEVSNHFHLNQRMADYAGQDFLWISRHTGTQAVQAYCQKLTWVQTVSVPSYQGTSVAYQIYLCDGFSGEQP